MMKLCVQVQRVVNRNTHFCCYHNAILNHLLEDDAESWKNGKC